VDVAIVGGGACGASLACHLLRDPACEPHGGSIHVSR
jgi:uncharacterized NAD(P)/FAD-binding protein YdhS